MINSSPQTRADILICKDNRNFFLDVVVANPAGTSYRNKALGSTVLSEKRKTDHYKRVTPNVSVLPFAVDATGFVGEKAQAFIDKFAGMDVSNFHASNSQKMHRRFFYRRLHLILAKANASMASAWRGKAPISTTSQLTSLESLE